MASIHIKQNTSTNQQEVAYEIPPLQNSKAGIKSMMADKVQVLPVEGLFKIVSVLFVKVIIMIVKFNRRRSPQ